MMKTRVLVVGLDGADWYVLSKWASRGELPNIRNILKLGAGGELESTVPPVTPPAWTTMVTGKKPEKHGICGGFLKVSYHNGRWAARPYSSLDKRSLEIWDLIDKSIVVNVPLTYPPKKIDGILVSGMFTPSLDVNFTYPVKFKEELFNVSPNYKTDIRIPLELRLGGAGYENLLSEIYEVTKARERLFWYLYKKDWRLLFFVFTETDRIQHFMWGTDEMLKFWRYIDSFLGNVVDEVSSQNDLYLILVSDHGFTKISKKVSISRILYQKKYLIPRNKLFKFIMSTKVNDVLSSLILRAHRILPSWFKRKLADVGKTSLWSDKSPVFVSGGGGGCFDAIYVRPDLPKHVRQDIIEKVKTTLLDIVDPEDNRKVVSKIRLKDKNFLFKLDSNECPDIVILPSEGYSFGEYHHKVIRKLNGTYGDHASHGILFAVGPEINPNTRIYKSRIEDIAPTLLHLLDIPIPPDVDGSVLKDMFRKDSKILSKEIRYMGKEEFSYHILRYKMRKRSSLSPSTKIRK